MHAAARRGWVHACCPLALRGRPFGLDRLVRVACWQQAHDKRFVAVFAWCVCVVSGPAWGLAYAQVHQAWPCTCMFGSVLLLFLVCACAVFCFWRVGVVP